MEVNLPLTPTSCVNYKAFIESSQDETENLLCRACRSYTKPDYLLKLVNYLAEREDAGQPGGHTP